MERTLIAWNIPNVVTIWLMAFIGFLAIGLIAQFVIGRMPSPVNQGQGY